MRRNSVFVSIFTVVLLGALVAGHATAISAQVATPASGRGATPGHPIVGTWRWANDRQNPADVSYAVVHADGTYVEMYPWYGVGIGTWEATGDRTIRLTIVFQDIDPSPTASEPGIFTNRLSIQLDEAGNTLTATGPLYLQTPDGVVVEERAFDGTATRVEVAATGPLTWPAMGTPTP